MPQFTQWQIVDPTPNILYNQRAIDESIAKQRSELGNLDINRQELALKQDEFARTKAFGENLAKGIPSDGTTGAGGAGGGGSFLDALAAIESGDKNIVSGVDKDSRGLTLAQGGNPSEISQGHFQIQTATWRDFAKQAGVDVNQFPTAMSAPREVQAQVASVIPLSRFGPRTQTLLRSRFGPLDTNQTVGALAGTPSLTFAPGTAGPRAAATPPPPPFNAYAGPRVAGAPPAGAPGAAPAAAPTAPPQPGFGALTPVPGAPTVTGQADANAAAVKQAAAGLLDMPEADAAVAYGPTIKALQARGFAMDAPAEYPGHAALQQAIASGGETPAPAVEPSRLAMRLGGTDVAGPGAGQASVPPVEQPNRLYATGLPGIEIRGPGNPLAPPPVAAAPTAPAAAPPGATRPPLEAPPAAPSRVVQREPTIQSGIFAGLTRTQAQTIAQTAAAGAKPAQVMEQIATARHQNDVIRQGDATAAAVQANEQYNRQRQYEETVYKRQQDTLAAAEKAKANAIAAANLKLSQETGAREAAKAHELTLDEIAPKMDDGTATPAEKRRYARSYYALQQSGGTAVTMTDPNNPGQQIPAMITRRLPNSYPEPEGGALPLVMSSPGAAKKAETKPLPDKERDQLLDGGAKLDQVITQQSSFRPDYAGYGSGWVGDLANMMKSAAGESPQADWWKGYQRYRLAIRQGISGQSLTKSEEAAFDRADINPGMAPSTIEHNLQLQKELTERIHNRRVKSLEADGYNTRAIQAASGDRPESAPSSSTTKPPPPGSKVIIP